jgi:hypothetical protein
VRKPSRWILDRGAAEAGGRVVNLNGTSMCMSQIRWFMMSINVGYGILRGLLNHGSSRRIGRLGVYAIYAIYATA